MKKDGTLFYSPTDLIRFMESPFATWMERLHLEFPGRFPPDEETEEQKLVAKTGNQHEEKFLQKLHADSVAQYRDGNEKVLGFLVGQAMKKTGGKANPKKMNDIIRKVLGQ